MGGQQAVIKKEDKAKIEALFSRALYDVGFRKELLREPSLYLTEVGLELDIVACLADLQRSSFEEIGINIRAYRHLLREDGYKYVISSER
jgi:hypothetical protein